MPSAEELRVRVLRFIRGLQGKAPGEYRMCRGGHRTLYASCFAAMALDSLGALGELSPEQRRAWAAYINSWQDPEEGYFVGPELRFGQNTSPKHDEEHLLMHLAAHALPALAALGSAPAHPLRFAEAFCGPGHLDAWLTHRDWREAWLEGNNLLFIGQFLIHLMENQAKGEMARPALERLMTWLDAELDPASGLWGTNGYCSPEAALFGGYHQIILYHYLGRPLPYPEALIDTALALQHADGGFNPAGGGGTCEDVDGIFVLGAQYHLTDHQRGRVRAALKRAIPALLRRQQADGGFAYRMGEPFIHQGLSLTSVPAGRGELFSTWFTLHALGLALTLLPGHPLAGLELRHNRACSMGWFIPPERRLATHPAMDPAGEPPGMAVAKARTKVRLKSLVRRGLGWACGLTGRFWALAWPGSIPPTGEAPLEGSLAQRLWGRVRAEARERAGAALPPIDCDASAMARRIPSGARVLHLGCGAGELAHSLAAKAVWVTALETHPASLEAARQGAPENLEVLGQNPNFALPEGEFQVAVLERAWQRACDKRSLLQRLFALTGLERILICHLPAWELEKARAIWEKSGWRLARSEAHGHGFLVELAPGGEGSHA